MTPSRDLSRPKVIWDVRFKAVARVGSVTVVESDKGPLERERICARCGHLIKPRSTAATEISQAHRGCLMDGIGRGDQRRRPAIPLPPLSWQVRCQLCDRLDDPSKLVQVLLHEECFIARRVALRRPVNPSSSNRRGQGGPSPSLLPIGATRCARCAKRLRPGEACVCRAPSQELAPVLNCPACGRPVHPNGKCGCL